MYVYCILCVCITVASARNSRVSARREVPPDALLWDYLDIIGDRQQASTRARKQTHYYTVLLSFHGQAFNVYFQDFGGHTFHDFQLLC